MGGGIAPKSDTKTVVVLGAAYGGARAAQIIASKLPEGWRLLLIDKNRRVDSSHANHVYVMPRFAVLPGHEYKAFIPYTKVFLSETPKPEQHILLNAHVLSFRPNSMTLSKTFPEYGIHVSEVAFDYAIYALGSHLPPPLDLWGSEKMAEVKNESVIYHGLKSEGCAWFKEKQAVIKGAPTVLVVGGGALGIQFATDIKTVYPKKKVTLLHSRKQLLPRFDHQMHDEILSTCQELNVEVILGERLDLSSIEDGQTNAANSLGQKIVRTVTGREIAADLLLLCTGQKANIELIREMDPSTISNESGLVQVAQTLQVDTKAHTLASSSTNGTSSQQVAYPHIFAIGDVADAFGAIPAGHNAYAQGEVAARNVLQLIRRRETRASASDLQLPQEGEEDLEDYKPGAPAIKVSLGISKAVYQVGANIGVKHDGQPDLQAASIWPFFGMKVEKDEDMYP